MILADFEMEVPNGRCRVYQDVPDARGRAGRRHGRGGAGALRGVEGGGLPKVWQALIAGAILTGFGPALACWALMALLGAA